MKQKDPGMSLWNELVCLVIVGFMWLALIAHFLLIALHLAHVYIEITSL